MDPATTEQAEMHPAAAAFHAASVEAMRLHTDGQLPRDAMQNIRADARAVIDHLPKHITDRMRDGAYERAAAEQAERSQIADLVVSESSRRSGRHVADTVKLADGDWLVSVGERGKDEVLWTTVVGGKVDTWQFYTQDEALLYLVHRRHNPKPDQGAVFYAGRVLGLPDADN